MELKSNYGIILLFLMILIVRVYLSLLNPLLSSDESYFNVKQVDNIMSTGKPLLQDPASWNGSKHHLLATFHYLTGFFLLFFKKELVFKILPQFFASLIVFPVYGILKSILDNKNFALIGAFMSAFIPVFFVNTINTFTPLTFALFLLFSLVYFFINLEQNLIYYIVFLTIASFSHPLILLYSVGIFGYVIFSKVENITLKQIEKEIILFSVFLPYLIYFVFYRNALLFHAKNIVWQNIPGQMLDIYFQNITLLGSIYSISVIPLLFGLYAGYSYLFALKEKKMYLISGFIISISLLLWQKMIALTIGGAIIGIFLCILAAQSLYDLFKLINKTKFSKMNNTIILLVLVLFILTSLVPGLVEAKNKLMSNPAKDKITAFNWIRTTAPLNSSFVALPEEGNYLNVLGRVKNVIDTDFLMKKDSSTVYNDIRRIFLTHSEIEAVDLMSKYNSDYLLITQEAKEKFNLKKWGLQDSKCFELVYNSSAEIYKKTCRRVRTLE
ncbi:glycosyltransferase family 39 protein [archaeon]|nr:glycosyltransferase family 39 protein [archaeon]